MPSCLSEPRASQLYSFQSPHFFLTWCVLELAVICKVVASLEPSLKSSVWHRWCIIFWCGCAFSQKSLPKNLQELKKCYSGLFYLLFIWDEVLPICGVASNGVAGSIKILPTDSFWTAFIIHNLCDAFLLHIGRTIQVKLQILSKFKINLTMLFVGWPTLITFY